MHSMEMLNNVSSIVPTVAAGGGITTARSRASSLIRPVRTLPSSTRGEQTPPVTPGLFTMHDAKPSSFGKEVSGSLVLSRKRTRARKAVVLSGRRALTVRSNYNTTTSVAPPARVNTLSYLEQNTDIRPFVPTARVSSRRVPLSHLVPTTFPVQRCRLPSGTGGTTRAVHGGKLEDESDNLAGGALSHRAARYGREEPEARQARSEGGDGRVPARSVFAHSEEHARRHGHKGECRALYVIVQHNGPVSFEKTLLYMMFIVGFCSSTLKSNVLRDSKYVFRCAPQVGAQDVHFAEKGAYTGSIAVGMVASLGCSHVLVGHSERRSLFGDDDVAINKKRVENGHSSHYPIPTGTPHNQVRAVLAAGLKPILCIGETKEQYVAGQVQSVCASQLAGALHGVSAEEMRSKVTIAYEPVWAIGTGLTATPAIAQSVHAFVRQWMTDVYGAQ
eukprot:5966954-Pyramimonas_sp.AAC.1